MCKRHVREISDKERDVGHVKKTICRRSGNIKRFRTCPRDKRFGNTQERKEIYAS